MSSIVSSKKETQQYSGTLDDKVKEYIVGFAPRLVHSMKSRRIDSNLALLEYTCKHFNVTSDLKIALDSQYETLCQLLPRVTELYQPEMNAVCNYVQFQLEQVSSWLLATMNCGAVFGFPSVSEEQQRRFICKYLLLALSEKGEKVLKYHLSYIFCRTTRQQDLEDFVCRERPPCEQGLDGVLFGGAFHQFLTRKLFLKKTLNRTRAQIAFSFLQSKRAWNPISRFQQLEALRKHEKAVCKKRNLPFNHTLISEVQRTVREVYGRFRRKREGMVAWTDRVPSLSAHFEKSRKEGGAQDYLGEHNLWWQDQEFIRPELVGFLEINGVPKEIRGFPRENVASTREQAVLGTLKLRRALRLLGLGEDHPDCEINHRWFPAIYEDELDTQVHIVLEPAKARIITAGPVVTYHRVRSFQKKIHTILRNHPTFQLIGKPLSEGVLDDFSKKLRRTRMADDTYMSADYSGATDNLHPELIEACADEIADVLGMDEHDASLYKRSLQDHNLVYPEQKHPYYCLMEECSPEWEQFQLDGGQQKWGQLMGSPSSFPVLCLINAAINRWFFEQKYGLGKRWKLKDLPMLVNGDDLLMTLEPKDYSEWWSMVRSCGLEPSLGKNYISKEFAMINSELWLENKDFLGNHAYWELSPFVNLGLLRGQGKVLGDTRRDSKIRVLPGDLISNSEKLLYGLKGDQRESIYSLWLSENRADIDNVLQPGQNWFIPSQLGGLGLPFPEREIRITRGQGKIASFLFVTKESKMIPKLEIFRPTYLRMEDASTSFLKDAVKWEWTDEEREEKFPSLTHFYESVCGVSDKSLPEEEELERIRVSQKWNQLWTMATNHRLKPLDESEIRKVRHLKCVPESKTHIIGSFLKSSLFSDD